MGSDPGAWDDLAVWTGSIARGDDGFWRSGDSLTLRT